MSKKGVYLNDKLILENISTDELDEVYELYKEGLFEFIDQTFGWNEEFQRSRFQSSYAKETLFWVLDGNRQRIGLLCYRKSDQALHLSLLLLYKAHQGSGIGRQIMEQLEALASEEGIRITLSTFKVNRKAFSFYQSLGYQVERQDENFYEMSKSFNRS